jgi:RNA polymerase sigma-70 factor, ECF subfamily
MYETIPVEEKEAIQKARAGEQEAFNHLVRLYRERVVQVTFRMCGNVDMAEDAAQIAFLKAWQSLGQYQPGTSFRNWLYRIAVNTAIDLLRQEKPQVDLDAMPLAAPDGSMTAWLEQQERIALVRRAILSLPEASRSVLILKEYEYLSYREIADILDIPIGTVMSRLNYARSLLAKQLRGVMEAE